MKRSDDGFAIDPAKSRATTQAAQDQRGRSWVTYPAGTPVLVAWGTARPRRAVVLWCGRCADCATIKVRFDEGGEWLAAADKVTKA